MRRLDERNVLLTKNLPSGGMTKKSLGVAIHAKA